LARRRTAARFDGVLLSEPLGLAQTPEKYGVLQNLSKKIKSDYRRQENLLRESDFFLRCRKYRFFDISGISPTLSSLASLSFLPSQAQLGAKRQEKHLAKRRPPLRAECDW